MVTTAGQFGVHELLEDGAMLLGEPRRLGLQDHARLHVGERLAPPQAERLAEQRRGGGRVAELGSIPGSLHQSGESMAVDVFGRHGEPVSGSDELQHWFPVRRLVEHLPQGGHPDLQRMAPPIGWEVGPQLLDEPVGADHVTVADDEDGQEGPVLRCPRGDVHTVDHRLERPEAAKGMAHYRHSTWPDVAR